MVFAGAAAMAVVSGLAQAAAKAQQGVIEAKRVKAQNKARIKQIRNQMDLSSQNLYNNEIAIDKQRKMNDIAIEENKLEAQDAFTQAFAGSGVSGRTVDLVEANMKNDVAKAHNENANLAKDTKDREFLGLMRQSQASIAGVKDLDNFDFGASNANSTMAGLSAGFQTFASSYSGDFGMNSSSPTPKANKYALTKDAKIDNRTKTFKNIA